MTPRVVGLDLSISATGAAVHTGDTLTVHPRHNGDARLLEIREAVRGTIGGCPPGTGGVSRWVALVVIEDLPTHAKAAGITGMVHGVVRSLLLGIGVPYALVPPASLKKYATGTGNAPKPDLRMELFKRTGHDIADDNQVDAAWLRLMGLDALGHPDVAMPKTHRAALDKITWPEVRDG